MNVRRLGAGDDFSGAVSLLQRFFREEGFDTPDDVIASNAAGMAALDSCALLVAEDGGQAIGVATVSMEFGIEFGWSAEMGDLYVLPEWRGIGLSRQIVAAAETWLRGKGATGYQVTVTPFAEAHHGLGRYYATLGFEGEGRLILYKRI